jgi:hypothetical protein
VVMRKSYLSRQIDTGFYPIDFDVQSAVGGLPSGIYFYKLQAGNFIEAKKMILLK